MRKFKGKRKRRNRQNSTTKQNKTDKITIQTKRTTEIQNGRFGCNRTNIIQKRSKNIT